MNTLTDIPPTDTATLPTVPIEYTPAERVWQALRHIEANPAQWDQDSWTRCLAGWTLRLSGRNVYRMHYDEVYREFRRLTGLGRWRANAITRARNDLPTLRRLTRRYFGDDPWQTPRG
jgi:hypothetical protein